MRGHTASLFAVAFSPDGRRLASGSDNGEVKVWDVMSGANTLSLPGHGGPVGQVIFSPDGARLVTSGGDGKIRVWALDLDDLIAIAKRKVTRAFTPEECRLYLHQATC
jgi:WD40 repeat protein